MSRTARPTTFFARLVNNLVQRNVRKEGEETLVGIDYKGNRYFEQVEGSPHQRKLDGVVLPKRWYFPADDNEDDWDQHIPPEWEAWMRYRRIEAPTEEEINLNLAVAHMKQVNAAKLEKERQLQAPSDVKALKPATDVNRHQDEDGNELPFDPETGDLKKPKFPVYAEYETRAGLGPDVKKLRVKRNDPFID